MQPGAAEDRVDLVRLQIADHVEANARELSGLSERTRLARQLLRTILAENPVAAANRVANAVDVDGLGDGDERDALHPLPDRRSAASMRAMISARRARKNSVYSSIAGHLLTSLS